MPEDAIAALPEWRPVCGPEALRQRAGLNSRIRAFFASRGVLEVETPLLGQHTVTDPALSAFQTRFHLPGQTKGHPLYLQTSPEFAMKRLLAAGSGSIYQICKAFRNEEQGRHHNPEFTLLEWYRVGFTLSDLIEEVEELIGTFVSDNPQSLQSPERLTYAEAFLHYTGLHPLESSLDAFSGFSGAGGMGEASELCGNDRTVWLDLLFSHFIQPQLGRNRLTSVYHYPAILPSLACLCPDDPRFVERVEIFMAGVELGNGFHELADDREQRQRFQNDARQRVAQALPVPELDERLLAALGHGLPDCSGIALGLDRLLMVLGGHAALADVLAFPIDRA